jgi:hypothetical protein
MNYHQTNRLLFVIAAITLFALAFFAGCSRSPLTVDNEPVEPKLLTRAPAPDGSPMYTPVAMYTEAVISSATGGELSLLDVNLSVPAGAVPNDTMFSISIPDPNVFYNDFGTDGLVFDHPVQVTMSYRDADLTNIDVSTIRIVWVDEVSGRLLEVNCTIDYQNQTVTGLLNHFSAYGLISD